MVWPQCGIFTSTFSSHQTLPSSCALHTNNVPMNNVREAGRQDGPPLANGSMRCTGRATNGFASRHVQTGKPATRQSGRNVLPGCGVPPGCTPTPCRAPSPPALQVLHSVPAGQHRRRQPHVAPPTRLVAGPLAGVPAWLRLVAGLHAARELMLWVVAVALAALVEGGGEAKGAEQQGHGMELQCVPPACRHGM